MHGALLALLAAAPGWSQEVSVTSTSLAQMWKQDAPGFDKANFAPFTQFLGIDATKLGNERLSLHLFGWGRTDLSDQSSFEGKSSGYLTYGYLQYRFDQANAEIKAGRFAISQGGGVEQVDGVSARADLRGGFTISAFGGRPVWSKMHDAVRKVDYEYQRDFIFGTRLGLRLPKFGEIGVSYLQDGTKAAKDLPIPSTTDYTRKQVGVDITIAPGAVFDLSGRTLFDVASRPDTPAGVAKPSKVAEHDYTVTVKPTGALVISANMAERNYQAFFAGTNLPSLFRTLEKGKFNAYGGSIGWNPLANLQLLAQFRHTDRESYGVADRMGAEVRWSPKATKIQTGFGFYDVKADDAKVVDATTLSYGLSHRELRAWVMVEKGKFFASLDGISQSFDDAKNPYLLGRKTLNEVVGSLGFQATANLRISGDLSYATTPLVKGETRGLLKAEYRFVSKGGKK
jgi:hypothetical protein